MPDLPSIAANQSELGNGFIVKDSTGSESRLCESPEGRSRDGPGLPAGDRSGNRAVVVLVTQPATLRLPPQWRSCPCPRPSRRSRTLLRSHPLFAWLRQPSGCSFLPCLAVSVLTEHLLYFRFPETHSLSTALLTITAPCLLESPSLPLAIPTFRCGFSTEQATPGWVSCVWFSVLLGVLSSELWCCR